MSTIEKSKGSILLVEDEHPLSKALTDKLAMEGYEVLFASNGEEGLSKALSHRPDVVLLDIVMPKMDGITLLKKLREDEWGKSAKVIVLSNLSDSLSIEQANEHQVSGYLIKTDWKLEDVMNKIESILS